MIDKHPYVGDFIQCVADDLGFEILHLSHGNGPNDLVIQPVVNGRGPDELTVQKFADALVESKRYFKNLPKNMMIKVVYERAEPTPYDTAELHPAVRYKIRTSF